MMNKRGDVPPAVIVLGAIVLLVIVILLWPSGSNTSDEADINDFQKFGDAIGEPRFNFVSYLIGGVPQFLINWTNPVSATIVILGLFLILLFMFSDILNTFGTFSSTATAWMVGVLLAVIAANLKVIMAIAVFGFSIAAGLGVLSVVVGVGTPFIAYLVVHFVFLKNLKDWVLRRKNTQEFERGANELKTGIKGIKAFGEAVKG